MEKIAKIIADIEKWFLQLDSFDIRNLDDLEDAKNFHAVSMLLFSIINGTITIGEETIATKRLGFPSSYREVFEILNKEKIISKYLSKEMSELVTYRNLFAHEYWSFTKKDVWEALQKIKNVKLFVNEIKKYFGRNIQ